MRLETRFTGFRLLVTLLAVAIANGCGNNSTTPDPPTITFTLNPTSATVDQGGSVAVAGTAVVGGSFTGDVTVTVEGLPQGVTGAVSNIQSNGTTTTVTVTLSVPVTVAAGTYPITVGAAGSGISVTATFTLTVTVVQEYSLTVSPDTITLEQGAGGSRDVALVRTNFTGDVDLSFESAPAGMTVAFSPDPATADASTATVSVGGAVAAGTYDVIIRGMATGLADRVDTLEVTVVAPTGPTFLLAVTPDTVRVNQNDSEIVSVDITRLNGFTGIVSLLFFSNQVGLSGSFAPSQVAGNTSDLTIGPNLTPPPGEYITQVQGSEASVTPRMVPLVVIVSAAPAYTIGAVPDTLTLDQGTNGDVAITLARTNFPDNVDLTIEGLPTGATASFVPASTTGDASTLTVAVGSGVVVGDYTLTVRGTTASLADVTQTFVLTVAAPVGFELSSIPDLTIQQGSSGSQDVTITRTGGFTGDVTLAMEGLAAGLTATISPNPVSGTTATITVSATASVAIQTYNPTIRGTATGVPDDVTSMDINVIAAAGTQVSMDFSVCSAGDRPVWVAFQDGGGAWTPVTGIGDMYTFMISSGTGGVTYVIDQFGESTIFTQYLTQAEFASAEFLQFCGSPDPVKTVNLTLANSIGPTNLSLGGAPLSVFADGPYSISGVGAGALDFVGFTASPVGANRMLILRDQDIADNGNIGTIDFTAGGFAAAGATVTIGGLSGGETLFGGMSYATVSPGDVCSVARLTSGTIVSNPFPAGGAPAAEQDADDFHVAVLTSISGTSSRTAEEAFQTFADRTVNLGAALPVPTVTDVSGTANYLRLQADFLLPAEYNNFTFFSYNDAAPSTVLLFASDGVKAGNVSFALPDFTGLAGWTDSWAPPTTATGNWGVSAFGQSVALPACTEGGREVRALQAGVF